MKRLVLDPCSPGSLSWESLWRFWFGDLREGVWPSDQARRWFRKRSTTDALIRRNFGALWTFQDKESLDHWQNHPRGCLSAILLADQVSRHLFRDDPRAFSRDRLALDFTETGIQKGFDRKLLILERVFFYFPLNHSEDLAHQERYGELLALLHSEASPTLHGRLENFLHHAKRHREAIQRFGRFPHRNVLLGRQSTDEERLYLQQPGSRF